jgi:hypothetical protein
MRNAVINACLGVLRNGCFGSVRSFSAITRDKCDGSGLHCASRWGTCNSVRKGRLRTFSIAFIILRKLKVIRILSKQSKYRYPNFSLDISGLIKKTSKEL